MNEEQLFLENVGKAINSSQDAFRRAVDLSKVDVPEPSGLSINTQILADYVGDFQFDWDNEAFEDEGIFATEAVAKVTQILADIQSGNEYKKIFRLELAYSHLDGNEYAYKLETENMLARTIDEAQKEKDRIRVKSPKKHPDDERFTFEDARLRVEIVDQNENTVIEEKYFKNLV